MDEYDEQDQIKLPAAVGKYHRYRCSFLKKTLQLVVSIALLSFFLRYSSGFSLFPHSFSVYFSTFLFSFFTHTLDRKYVFLICNGILAFLAKSSVSSSCSSPSEESDIVVGAQTPTSSANSSQTKASDVINEEPEDTYKNEVEDQGGQQNESLGREEEEEETESPVSVIVEDVDQDYREEEEEGVGVTVGANEEVASTEELNRKIEEFIRKLKEEIRIEAQQQLVAV